MRYLLRDLLALLRELLDPETYEMIKKALIDLLEQDIKLPDEWDFIERVILSKVREQAPGKEKLVERVFKDIAPRAHEAIPDGHPPAPPAPPSRPLLTAARVFVYGALAYLLIAAAVDRYVVQAPVASGKGPCSSNTPSITLKAQASATGSKGALKMALEDLSAQCATTNISCVDPACGTCGKDVFLSTADVESWLFWYVAKVQGDCRCWCK